MPARLRPTAPIAADAILVGDPGRALMLAQELLEQPKMSNHARGLWGYSGRTPEGHELTIQATGMGGPSASVVLADLAELGVRRAIRIGTCASLGDLGLGEVLIVTEAQPVRGSFVLPERTKEPHERVVPDPALTRQLRKALPEADAGVVVSLDSLHDPETTMPSAVAAAADMQTAALLRTARGQNVAAAAVLIVAERSDSGLLRDAELEDVAKRVGRAASSLLSA
jgi:purine-nucleoside phosphorylase